VRRDVTAANALVMGYDWLARGSIVDHELHQSVFRTRIEGHAFLGASPQNFRRRRVAVCVLFRLLAADTAPALYPLCVSVTSVSSPAPRHCHIFLVAEARGLLIVAVGWRVFVRSSASCMWPVNL